LQGKKKSACNPSNFSKQIHQIIIRLEQLFASTNITKAQVVEALKEYLPGFEHIETGKGLDENM